MLRAHATCCALALMLIAPAARAEPTPEAAPPAAPTTAKSGSYVAAAVAFGLAGAALGVGAVAGGISLSDAGTVESSCHAGMCPASQRGPASTAKTLGDLSTASIIVGGAAAVTGIVLLLALPAPAAQKRGAGVSWTAGVGVGRLTFGARF